MGKHSPIFNMTKGTRVVVTVYGQRRTGVVSRTPSGSGIIFVRLDLTPGERWFHAESLTVLPT